MKKLLIITFYFFPNGHIATQRPARLAKYLRCFGWEPSIACVDWRKDSCGKYYDAGLLEDLSRQNVICSTPIVNRGSGAFRKSEYLRLLVRRPKLLIWKLIAKMDFRRHPERLPIEFYKDSISILSSILRQKSFDAIWATNPPAVPHAIADHLSREFRIPWVADFRDIWDMKCLTKDEQLRRRLIANEVGMIKSSLAVVTVSQPLAAALRMRHCRTIDVMPNGFDPDDYSADDTTTVSNRKKVFSIVYTGNVCLPFRDPNLLFQATANLLNQGKLPPDGLQIVFYGSQASLDELVSKEHLCLQKVVVMEKRVSRKECLKIQQEACVLLHLAHPEEKGILTGKIFEYLGARRPIISLPSDNSVVEEILRKTNAGISCSTVEDVEGVILEWHREWKETGTVMFTGKSEEIEQYSGKHQAEQLAEILDRITKPISAGSVMPGVPMQSTECDND